MRITLSFTLVLFCVVICAFGYSPSFAKHRGRAIVTLHRFRHRPVAPLLWSTPGSSITAANTIVSPFDTAGQTPHSDDQIGDAVATGTRAVDEEEELLTLTVENVELVLDSMRPYLKADGGNVRLAEIDGPVVKLELEGACGTCPSSAMTMKMGLERKLKQRIPEISDVIQSMPSAPTLNEANIETVLAGVRPFLAVAGGTINLLSLSGAGGLQPSVVLDLRGTAAALQSVKTEIQQRIQRHFMAPVRVEWKS